MHIELFKKMTKLEDNIYINSNHSLITKLFITPKILMFPMQPQVRPLY